MDRTENHHPADQLAEVRAEIKRLQVREADLRDQILGLAEQEREGRRFRAVVKTIRGRRLDADQIRATMPPEWIAQHERETEVIMVKLAKTARRQ